MKRSNLIPAVIQDSKTGVVLMLGYMDDEALQKTKQTGMVWFWSRSKKKLWKKGETSGNTLSVVEINTDCDSDTLLISVNPTGPTCHTGSKTCFTKSTLNVGSEEMTLERLFSIVESRKKLLPDNSYTASLFKSGKEKMREKIVEESAEVIAASTTEGRKRVVEESADLLYHLFVLLVAQNITLEDIENELMRRSIKTQKQ